ncbi:MAG: xanthine dehydrogenase family protein subunit M [Rhodospirillaceae bacterium]|nr:xanthine dehydrogenase family protein subunit M [Rhodospirillaceae bacterium]MDD9916985.1 xanthine dehydrogenase family protein subunit M [Rhodospirillaceae bacterium]MDD9926022.1 xanthine dehydrogenase family protein subunit M [Rhodospirillaceae bacterium]
MTPFELAQPASLAEAIALLDPNDTAIRPIAGGTALMLMMKMGLYEPQKLISLRGIEPRYSEVAATADGGLRIGAVTPLRQLEMLPVVAERAPVIARTMRRLSNVRVRNVARLGGHLAHGDPHLDLPPVLIALGATLVIAGPNGERTIAVEDLFQGYLETALAPDELIVEVNVPATAAHAAYMKHTTRSADDWPALGIAVALDMQGDRVSGARVAIGAATDTPRRLTSVETALQGEALSDAALNRAGEAAAAEAEVHSDARGSAAYKRELIRVFTGRAIRQATGREA